MDLPERLRDLRRKKKLTQQQVADQLGISQSTYAGYEIGRLQPTLDMLKKLSQFYDVTTDYLLGETDKPNRVAVRDENNLKIGWLKVVDDAKSAGLTPEDMQPFIDAAKTVKRK